jgi:hypothetical protein
MTGLNASEITRFFPTSYWDARARFRAVCEHAGIRYQSLVNPSILFEGQPLTTEVAHIGAEDAAKMLILVSGIHGLEGFCGSGCQVGWISHGGYNHIPDDTAVLMIHFANPYGGAFLSRTTEENIDLNRNFVDWDSPPSRNIAYSKLHAALCCTDTGGEKRKQAECAIESFQREYGMPAYYQAISGAQYEFEDGMFFGGHASTWARKNLESILLENARQAQDIALIDFHTGLGPYGYGTPVALHHAESDALKRATAWYGPSLFAPHVDADPEQQLGEVSGSFIEGVTQLLSAADITAIALEFGTYPFESSFPVFREDHRLGLIGENRSPKATKLKQKLREIFYPASSDWREMVWPRANQIIEQALTGLKSLP